jgi:hypothetical protein
MSVPSRYELKNDNHRLVLDCDYSVDEEEKGFVLKWHRDGVQIYQWIASRQPYALVDNFDILKRSNGFLEFKILKITKIKNLTIFSGIIQK